MKRSFAFLFIPLFLLAGCIEFESQSVTYAYDAPTDTLKIFQNYHGIFGGDATNSLSKEELNQLDSVLNSQRTFFFGNWISEISHDQLREQLNQLKEEAAKESKPDPRYGNLETLLKLLVDHVRIENGGWYIDGDGKLSGIQRVTITGVSNLVVAGNLVIRDAYKDAADHCETNEPARAIYLKSIEQPREYIKFEGNRITVRLPATKTEYEEHVLAEGSRKQLEQFKKCGGQVNFKDNEIIASIGQPTDKQTTLTMSFSEKTYRTNLLQEVKKRGLIQEKLDPAGVARSFF